MNRARVATLLHELVDAVFDDVAEEHEPRDPDPPPAPPSRPKTVNVSDLDRAAARRALHRVGGRTR